MFLMCFFIKRLKLSIVFFFFYQLTLLFNLMTCLSIIRVFCSVFLQFLATLIGGLAVEWQKAVTAHQSPISDHPARHIWSPRCLCSCLHHISAGFTFFLKTQTTSHIISSAYGRNIMNGNKTSLIFLIDVLLQTLCLKPVKLAFASLRGLRIS